MKFTTFYSIFLRTAKKFEMRFIYPSKWVLLIHKLLHFNILYAICNWLFGPTTCLYYTIHFEYIEMIDQLQLFHI